MLILESGPSKSARVQSALPVVLQGQSKSQERLKVVFVVNVILKMGLPVLMADNDGFRSWLAMLNPKFQLKHRTSVSLLVKQIATASFEKLKDKIQATISDGSNFALTMDAWTARNHTRYLGLMLSWISSEWKLEDGLLGLKGYDPDTEGLHSGELVCRELHTNLQRAGIIPIINYL